MQKIESSQELNAAIDKLETQWILEGIGVKEHFHETYNKMKPVNLIKSTFLDLAASKEVKSSLINTSVGVVTGYLAKFLFVGMSANPIKNVLGTAIMFGVKSMVAKNPEAIQGVFNLFSRKSKVRPHSEEDTTAGEAFTDLR